MYIWFISFFFMSNGSRYFLILSFLFICGSYVDAQCPDRSFFRDKIASVFNAAGGKTDEQLNIFLQLEKQMEECHLQQDSVFM
ncbi:MAG: hypothetical protein M3N30_13800, partial [Bacteroidota bacterium]|nr:hypothetical protein [Bacteroidota bacterium]